MKSCRIFLEICIILSAIKVIYCNDLRISESNNSDNIIVEENSENSEITNGDIDRIWGAINSDSVRIDTMVAFEKNVSIGSIAEWNATMITSRVMDGIMLRSVNNTGAVGEIIDGGIGFKFVTFQLVGHANYFYFFVDAFENYTSSLITTTTPAPVPEIIFKEWGTINYASLPLYPSTSYIVYSDPGVISFANVKINASGVIDGVRLISRNHTVASGEITNGGIGYDFITVYVVAYSNILDCKVELYANGTYTTTAIPITTSTTSIPETRVEILGRINDNSPLLDEKRFHNYPDPWTLAFDYGTLSSTDIIIGIRLTSLNHTDGLWEIIDGGLNQKFVTFNFRGAGIGRPYDFNIEIFGNSAAVVKLSVVLVILLLCNEFRKIIFV